MAPLHYKTRGMTNPKGKPRVYFCCHPEDFTRCFDAISDEVPDKQNCAIWYTLPDEEKDEVLFSDLEQMQLFVVPVTTALLYLDGGITEKEIRFALEHHIPILPLMQEPGLEERFNQVYGDLQFLDKGNNDPTAVSYEEKLEKYLESVLIGDDLANKIRAAFDAYVFLSYRKKDRKYAQELMRLIHKNEFCRDIAIWYDEFLTPGENFNDSIRDALQKSGLFVLTVTPSLLETVVDGQGNECDNYIVRLEYPMAKKEGKPILPVELVATDKDGLAAKYEDIPICADGHNAVSLSDALLEAVKKMVIRENDASPEHNFFIGLAYLGGVDVEVDHDRAIKIITAAAEGNLLEATKKLVDIYHKGIGVKKDCREAIKWQIKLLSQMGSIKNEETFTEVFFLGKLYQEVGEDQKAQEMFSLIRTLGAKTTTGLHYLAKATYELGNIVLNSIYVIPTSASHDLAQAQKAYQKVDMLYTECVSCLENIATAGVGACEFSICNVYLGFANLYFDQSNYPKCRYYIAKTLDLYSSTNHDVDDFNVRLLIDAHFLSGEVALRLGDWNTAFKELQCAYDLLPKGNHAKNQDWIRTYESNYHYKCAVVYYEEGKFDDAMSCANSAVTTRLKLTEENPYYYNWDLLSKSYDLLSVICLSNGNHKESAEYAQLAFDASMKCLKLADGSEMRASNTSAQQMGRFIKCAENGDYDSLYTGLALSKQQLEYKEYIEKRIAHYQRLPIDLESKTEHVVFAYREIAGLYFTNNNYIEAVNIYLKLLEMLEMHYNNNPKTRLTGLLASYYYKTSTVYSYMRKMSTSLDYGIKSAKLLEPHQKRYEKLLHDYEIEDNIDQKKHIFSEIEAIATVGYLPAIEFVTKYYIADNSNAERMKLLHWQSILTQRYADRYAFKKTKENLLSYKKEVYYLVQCYIHNQKSAQAYDECERYVAIAGHLTGDRLAFEARLLLNEIING